MATAIKGFVLSMVETAITVTDGRIPAQDIHTILSFGRTMLEHPVDLIEGAVRERCWKPCVLVITSYG